jgi:hypothetical protein
VLGACGGSLSPQDSTHMVGAARAGGSCTHGTFLHSPCCHTRRPWGDPVGAPAAPLGEVSRSAGSRGLWGQSEPLGLNANSGGRAARWQLYTLNRQRPTAGRRCGRRPAALALHRRHTAAAAAPSQIRRTGRAVGPLSRHWQSGTVGMGGVPGAEGAGGRGRRPCGLRRRRCGPRVGGRGRRCRAGAGTPPEAGMGVAERA